MELMEKENRGDLAKYSLSNFSHATNTQPPVTRVNVCDKDE